MGYLAGRLGSITGPGWAANIQNWRFDHAVELPDATVLGTGTGGYDDHVIGIKGGTVTCEVLFDTVVAVTTMNPGTTGIAVALIPDLAANSTTRITFTGTIISTDWNQDRRGISSGTIVIKTNGAVTYTESA